MTDADVTITPDRPATPETGWARSSLDHTLRWAFLTPLMAWQVVLCAVVLTAEGLPPLAPWLTAGHLLVVGLALVAARDPHRSVTALLIVCYALLISFWWISPAVNSVVSFSAAWFGNLMAGIAAFLLPRHWSLIVPPAMGAVIGLSMALRHPDWMIELPISVATTPLFIAIFCWRARHHLMAFATRADHEAATAAQERESITVARAAMREAAETSRTLHDTVINTLGALANGVRSSPQDGRVQQRCAEDVTTVEALLGQEDHRPTDPHILAGLEHGIDIDVRRHGLEDDALLVLAGALPDATVAALRGAAREALQNASKHSGAEVATIDAVAHDGMLRIIVSDHGTGFDGAALLGGTSPSFGLRESVLARCGDAGVDVHVSSALGQGTSVSLTCPVAGSAGEPDDDQHFSDVAASTQRRVGLLWASGVVAVGVAIEISHQPGGLTPVALMLALGGGAAALAWATSRGDGRLSGVTAVTMVLVTPVMFVLALAGVDFGRAENVNEWQAIGVTGPPAIALFLAQTLRPFIAAVTGLLAAGAITWWAAENAGIAAAGIVPIGTAAALACLAALYVFRNVFGAIGRRAADDHAEAESERVELAAREAADTARARWRTAGLEASVQLLSQVADGAVDPTDPVLRAACGREERHLRQLLLLSPELIHLGQWLTRASALARDRGVVLNLRTGDADAPDAESAAYLGRLVVAAVEATPSEETLTVGLFQSVSGQSLTIVGSHDGMARARAASALPSGWSVTEQLLAGQYFVEITWTSPAPVRLATSVPA